MWKIILVIWLVYALAYNYALIRKPPRSKRTAPPSRGWGNRLRMLVIGATGSTGRELVRQALEKGHQVTAFVRKPKKLKVEHPNLRIVQGNVLHYTSVEAAMQGQSVVVSALGHKRLFWPTKILSHGTRNIMRAMKTCRVPRFICESSLGVGNAVGRLGLAATLGFVPLVVPRARCLLLSARNCREIRRKELNVARADAFVCPYDNQSFAIFVCRGFRALFHHSRWR
jgi:nucleoside-diphosphate-sugar epimerase